ncbi:PELP1 [Sanghuangporus vaninii]
MTTTSRKTRTPYTQDDDALLMKYIAIYNPDGANRLGNALYSRLVANAEGKWPWSKRHSWQSWRERYRDHQHRFDANIKKYQKRKGIKVPEKYSKISFSELERRVKLEALTSSPNGGTAAADPEFSSPEPPTLRRIKRVSATQPQTREERHENEGPRPEPAQPSTQGHKMLATRPARKTAIVAAHSEPEEGEIISQEEGEIGSDGEHRKRKAEEVKVTSGSKRQRMHSDASVSRPPMNGHLPADKGSSIKPPSKNGPAPSTINRLESLSPFSKNGNVLDNKQTLALLLEALRSQPEGQKEAIEFIKNRLSQAGPSTNGQANTDDQGRLYPRLEKEDYDITGPRTAGGGIPGSWNGAEGPVTNAPAKPLRQTNDTSNSALVERDASVTPNAKDGRDTSASNGSLAKTRQLASYNKSAEDFFETPSPTPERADVAQPGAPSPLAPKVHDHGENKENNPEQENISSPSKRDSPQHRNITPTSPFVPSFRRPAKPRRKAPDMDSGSETEVVLEEHPVREMNSSQSAKESWPPLRKKKSSEVKVSPPRADNAIQNVIADSTEKPTKGAPITEIVGSTLAGTPKVPSLARDLKIPRDATPTSGDKPQRATNSTKVQDEKTTSDKVQATQQSLNVRPLQAASEASPLRARVSILRPTTSERINRTEVHARRSEAPVANIRSASTSITTESDPFLTKDHAMRLRRVEKGKEKEVAASAMGEAASEAKARADRRKTFAGFPTLKPPEIDLRKRALRTSAGNTSNVVRRLSFSPSVAPRNDEEQDNDQEESRIRRRASVAATIDLSQEFPSPDMNIPPADHAFIIRAGVQVLLQSIAQNHSVSEDFVRGIYEELLDLQATDRVVSKMRQVAERAVEKELEREKRKKRNSDVPSVPISRVPSVGHKADLGPSSVQSSPERREADFSALSEPARGRSVSGPRRSELLITPADEDPTFVRLRNQYVPPSTSRAARFVRHRARRSSGLANSPLNGYGNDEEDMQVDDYEDDEKEEEEVFMALTPGRMLGGKSDSFSSGPAELGDAPQNASGMAGQSNKAREADTSFVQPWTIEEDEILLDGEDEEAIKAIEERRGKRAVKWRLAELSAGDILS